MVPVHMVLVVQGTLVAWDHHRFDLPRQRACPWGSLKQLGVDLEGRERGSTPAHRLERFTCLDLVSLLHALQLQIVLLCASGRLHTYGMLINMTRVAATRGPFVVVTIRKVGDLKTAVQRTANKKFDYPWGPIESLYGINVILVQLEVGPKTPHLYC